MPVDRDFRDRDFSTSTSYTRMEGYVQSVVPRHVRSHAREILESVKEEGVGRYKVAAALARHVFEEVEYSEEGDLWRADYILDKSGRGDCEDHATLLASLLVCRSFDVCFVVVDKSDDKPGHLMLEVLFTDVALNDLVDEAASFYDRTVDFLGWERYDNDYWLVCDTASSPVVGVGDGRYYSTNFEGRVRWKTGVRRDYLEV